jgi:hypothetical protein
MAGFVLLKGVDLLRCGRQPREIERSPAYQGPTVRSGRRRNPLSFQLRQHKPINFCFRPAPIFHRGWGRHFDRLERPERSLFMGDFEWSAAGHGKKGL